MTTSWVLFVLSVCLLLISNLSHAISLKKGTASAIIAVQTVFAPAMFSGTVLAGNIP
jgi:hypothetical protein